jgi:hypothetical protein
VHAYLITAKPSAWRRAARAARVWTVRLLIALGLILLGTVVLTLRCARPIVNLLADAAARTELEVSLRTGLPAVGATIGAHLAHEFVREFRRGFNQTTA